MSYTAMVASKTIKQLVAMKRSLEASMDDVGCFSASDPQLLQAVEAELERRNCETTEDYWDCECEGFNLHSKDQETCPKCGARHEDSPNSRVVKVEEEVQSLIMVIQCLKDDDVDRVLDNALSPEMKARLAEWWS
jgi:hypothetical protein